MTYSVHLLRHLRLVIGQNIHRERVKQKMTLAKLAKLTGIPVVKLDQFEMGKNEIDLNMLFKITAMLDVALPGMIQEV